MVIRPLPGLVKGRAHENVRHSHHDSHGDAEALTRSDNSLAAAARDLVLPRLISGELAVAAAERQLEDAP